jgi:ArsR family transcriptional regulator, arsenate/arsenite/antimonite-responsive transcriptional repressor
MINDLVPWFRALSDPTRLRLLSLISSSSQCVEDLVTALTLSQPKVSRHLAYLRRAGLVECERRGRRIYYRLTRRADPFQRKMIGEVARVLALSPQSRADRRRLASYSVC